MAGDRIFDYPRCRIYSVNNISNIYIFPKVFLMSTLEYWEKCCTQDLLAALQTTMLRNDAASKFYVVATLFRRSDERDLLLHYDVSDFSRIAIRLNVGKTNYKTATFFNHCSFVVFFLAVYKDVMLIIYVRLTLFFTFDMTHISTYFWFY